MDGLAAYYADVLRLDGHMDRRSYWCIEIAALSKKHELIYFYLSKVRGAFKLPTPGGAYGYQRLKERSMSMPTR